MKPPETILPPARGLIVLLVLLVLGVGLLVYWDTQKVVQSTRSLPLPGASGVECSYLPVESGGKGLALEQVLARADAFVPMEPDVTPRTPPPPQAEGWYRLKFENRKNEAHPVALGLFWRYYDRVTLYVPQAGGGYRTMQAGETVAPWEPDRSRLWMGFDLTLPAAASLTVYVHARDYYRVPEEFVFWPDAHDFTVLDRYRVAQYSGYFWLWAGFVAYNLFLYAILRRRDNLHYVLFAVGLGALVFASSNMTTLFFPWPTVPVRETVVGLIACSTMLNICLFARHFLELARQDPRLDRRMRWLQRILLANMCTLPICWWPSVSRPYLATFAITHTVILLVILWAGLSRWKARSAQAPFFVIAYLPLCVGLSLWMLGARNIVLQDEVYRSAVLIGSSLELVLLSLAVAYRHRRVLEENIRLQSDYAARLEREVDERTQVLKALSDRLSSTLAERDRILAIIGHDLRGPASSLQGLTRILAADAASFSGEELASLSREIDRACTQQLELLNNLLVWGGTQSGNRRTQLSELAVAGTVAELLHGLAKPAEAKAVSLIAAIPSGLVVQADGQLVLTILRNLLANALKFTRPGGRIEVTVAAAIPGKWELRVKDDGVGIAPERLVTLFTGVVESTRGTRGEAGTGIGLNLCRDLARAAGGDLRLESVRGQGTTAFLVLPTGGSRG